MPQFLGLDSSTQGITAIVVEIDDATRRVVCEHSLEYDRDFPAYGTTHGVHRHDDQRKVTSSPILWADALDRMLSVVVADPRVTPSAMAAISGSAQQHGSVYLNASAEAAWKDLDSSQPLAGQISKTFSRAESPVWLDASTQSECEAIAQRLGGPEAVAQLTGSAPFERFTGPQIRKFAADDPAGYAATDRIHLVSSYLASLLIGRHAPIDPGDGAGMNLMDLRGCAWSPAALDATASSLASRLPALRPSWSVADTLSDYWQNRHRLPAARVITWSGDNPCSLVGAGLIDEGRVGISLGTSDTVFGFTPEPRPTSAGSCHVFGAPTGGYMTLICFSNGALARERIRDAYGLDWSQFSEALRTTPAGNGGRLMLPWFEPEITPHVPRAGVQRRGLDPQDAPANVRAVIEAQMMALANHAADVMGTRPAEIVATGGASANREILQVMADVFDADVYPTASTNTAALGAALRAYHGYERALGREHTWKDVVDGFTQRPAASRVQPVPEHVEIYRRLREEYRAFEDRSQNTGGRR